MSLYDEEFDGPYAAYLRHFTVPPEEVPPGRLRPDERYRRDPKFAGIVDLLTSLLAAAEYTPTELREATMLAAIRHEMYNARYVYRIAGPTIERVDRSQLAPDEPAVDKP